MRFNGAEYNNIELGFASFKLNSASPRSILLYSAPILIVMDYVTFERSESHSKQ
jgi:hypothetical protein